MSAPAVEHSTPRFLQELQAPGVLVAGFSEAAPPKRSLAPATPPRGTRSRRALEPVTPERGMTQDRGFIRWRRRRDLRIEVHAPLQAAAATLHAVIPGGSLLCACESAGSLTPMASGLPG
jgi:hypothetical protein